MSKITKETAAQLASLVGQPDVWNAVRQVLEIGAAESREVCCEEVRKNKIHEAAVCAGKIEAFEQIEALIAGVARNFREGKPPYDK